ncbi:MAG: hypothetical protein ACRDXX_13210 [Stackebrandtia sp.]
MPTASQGVSVELIADLVGHRLTNTTRLVYRHELRPVITEGADIIAKIFAEHDEENGEDEEGSTTA